MDFSFTDDFYEVTSSIDSALGFSTDQTLQPEFQLALSGHHSTQHVMELMQNYFEQNSRPSSPRHDKPKHRWFSAPPRFQIYDEQVMTVFVDIANHHLTKAFPIFADSTAAEDSRKELRLAHAAVGGLFCNIPGRFKVVNSMYNDARRILLDPVTILENLDLSACTYAKQTYHKAAMSLEDKLSTVKTVSLREGRLVEIRRGTSKPLQLALTIFSSSYSRYTVCAAVTKGATSSSRRSIKRCFR